MSKMSFHFFLTNCRILAKYWNPLRNCHSIWSHQLGKKHNKNLDTLNLSKTKFPSISILHTEPNSEKLSKNPGKCHSNLTLFSIESVFYRQLLVSSPSGNTNTLIFFSLNFGVEVFNMLRKLSLACDSSTFVQKIRTFLEYPMNLDDWKQ